MLWPDGGIVLGQAAVNTGGVLATAAHECVVYVAKHLEHQAGGAVGQGCLEALPVGCDGAVEEVAANDRAVNDMAANDMVANDMAVNDVAA